MSDTALRTLATEAGLQPSWTDAFGKKQDVSVDTLRAVLAALGLPADSDPEIEDSLDRLRTTIGLPPVLTADAGQPVVAPVPAGPYEILLEGGGSASGHASENGDGALVRAPDEPGYHRLRIAGQECLLATAPSRCFGLADARADGRRSGPGRAGKLWGLSAQLYSLRRPGDGGLGDFGALADLVRAAARHGAQAVSISPVHAQFSADPDRFSPYAPSSRVAQNVLHATVNFSSETARVLEAGELVDWPGAGRLRLETLRRGFERALQSGELAGFEEWRAQADEGVELHARFEALHQHHFADGHGPWNWQDWPQELHDSASAAVEDFARAHAPEVTFHAWLQYRAELGLASAQEAALDSGMAVGLISDLAVGADAGGSQCWSRPEETLMGLTIGAPPDLLSRDGQDWGITTFSPRGLRQHGFRAFVEMLRTALRHAGGMRVDHAMGLSRLWVVPAGAPSASGTYLSMPEADLLRLVRLESARHRSIVLGEDLGTVPEGFADRLQDQGVIGMRVLWFEKDGDIYRPPSRWSAGASAMTSTHDLPTVSGWWRGRDIDWNERLGRTIDPQAARAERAAEREHLWAAMRESGAASAEMPDVWNGWAIADAAADHVGRSGCELVMLPLEDALALEEAPNLPGTVHEHPNWRRRLPGPAATILDEPQVASRLARLDTARRQAG